MTAPYIISNGTVTLTNGSSELVGDGTTWLLDRVLGGRMAVEVAGGNPLDIVNVEDNTTATAATKWMGPDGTYSYSISLLGAQAAETIWASRHWARVVGGALLSAIPFKASGTATERDALNPPLANGEWFGLAEPDTDEIVAQLKVPDGWLSFSTRGGKGDAGQRGDGLVPAGEWDGDVSYARARLVWHGPRSFASLHDDNLGNEPPDADEDDEHWQYVPAAVGPANVLEIGTVTGGETADATITGTAPAQVLNLVLPEGAPGQSLVARGPYSAIADYNPLDIVYDQSVSWIALQETTGNAPPTLPTESNAYWTLMVIGGGSIDGPVSSTDGAVALWDGTGGDALKDGPVLGTAAGKDTGTSGDAVPLLDGNNVWGGSARFNSAFGVGTAPSVVGGIYFHRTSGDAPFLLFSYGDPNAPTNIGQFRGSGGGGILGITGPSGSPYGVAYNPSLGRVGIMTNAPAHTLSVNGVAAPLTDNANTLGASGYRWSVVWAATGTISTSDARDKEVVARVGDWAADVVDAVEPALYRWLVGGNDVVQVEDGYDEEERYVFEDATELVEEVAIEDGRAVVHVVERTVKRQVYDDYPMVDAAGEPVMVAGAQAVHRVPRVEIVQIPRYRDEAVPVAGQRLHAGWLAQEVKAALDAAGIDCGAWGLDDAADPNSRQWVRPDQMVAIMWAALRETRQELAELRAQVEG